MKRPKNDKPNVLFRNAGNGVAEIYLYEEIGDWGITAKQFADELKGLGTGITTIKNRINSPGGDVFEAAAIYQLLVQHPAKVETHIDGMAMSAATVIALAGDTVAMAANGLFMIHDPITGVYGNRREMLKVIDVLDKVTETIVGVYTAKTQATEDAIRKLMQEETYYTAEEAKSAKFVDTISPNKHVSAMWSPDDIRNAFRNALNGGGSALEAFKHDFFNLPIPSDVLPSGDVSDVDWDFENRMLLRRIESDLLSAA